MTKHHSKTDSKMLIIYFYIGLDNKIDRDSTN